MSEVRANNLTNVNQTGGPTLSGITTFSSPHFFVPPRGDTASRPSGSPIGALRFNTDSAKLEYYRGDTIGWTEIEADSSEVGGGSGSNENSLGARGIFGGGSTGTPTFQYFNAIEFITVSTFGNSQDFGDLIEAAKLQGGGRTGSTRSRMLFAGNYSSSRDAIEFVTVHSKGNSTDFGNLSVARYDLSTCNDTVRAIFGGGISPTARNTMDYVTISTTGNALDFGDIGHTGGCSASHSSSTRGFYYQAGGPNAPKGALNTVVMRTLGNSTHWADSYTNNTGLGGGSNNAVRAIYGGGYLTTAMNFFTLATQGNGVDFGDLYQRCYNGTSSSSSTRWCLHGGQNYVNVGGSHTYPAVDDIQTVQFASTGNAVEFGTVTTTTSNDAHNQQGGSNEHGGI